MSARYEDLVNPDDIVLIDGETLAVQPPDYLVKIARGYRMLERDYPWIIPYLERDEPIPFGVLVTNA